MRIVCIPLLHTHLADQENAVCSPVPTMLGALVGNVVRVSLTVLLALFLRCSAD